MLERNGGDPVAVLLNGLTIQKLPYYAFDIVKAVVLVAALAVTYVYAKNKFAKS